jgi:uncharacterized repeat protein (TIGR03803 family)
MTTSGGTNNKGVLFKYNQNSNQYFVMVNFSDSLGSEPHGSLIRASNGLLYGMTRRGGLYNGGVIFKFDTQTKVFTKIYDFQSPSGTRPLNELFEASNGLLYGTTSGGGMYNGGVVFEFDPVAEIFTKMVDLDKSGNGGGGYSFTEVFCPAPGITAAGPTSFCTGGSVLLNAIAAPGAVFQWHKNGSPITGATGSGYIATSKGVYTVVATDMMCNTTYSSNEIRVSTPCIPPSGNGEKIQPGSADAKLNLFSHHGQLNIKCENLYGYKYTISVIDVTGKIVQTRTGTVSEHAIELQLDLSPFATGIYTVKLNTESEKLAERFLKQ